MYEGTFFRENACRRKNAIVTAGLKWAPEVGPIASIRAQTTSPEGNAFSK